MGGNRSARSKTTRQRSAKLDLWCWWKKLCTHQQTVIMISLVLNLRLSDRALHRSSPICRVIFYNQVFTANSPWGKNGGGEIKGWRLILWGTLAKPSIPQIMLANNLILQEIYEESWYLGPEQELTKHQLCSTTRSSLFMILLLLPVFFLRSHLTRPGLPKNTRALSDLWTSNYS